jgi:acetolactate synthase regulatory subunit
VRQTDGGLERILSVTRRRRFDLLQLKVNTADDGAHLDVEMTVRAERAGLTLVRQIEKLQDVSHVSVVDSPRQDADARTAHIAV